MSTTASGVVNGHRHMFSTEHAVPLRSINQAKVFFGLTTDWHLPTTRSFAKIRKVVDAAGRPSEVSLQQLRTWVGMIQ